MSRRRVKHKVSMNKWFSIWIGGIGIFVVLYSIIFKIQFNTIWKQNSSTDRINSVHEKDTIKSFSFSDYNDTNESISQKNNNNLDKPFLLGYKNDPIKPFFLRSKNFFEKIFSLRDKNDTNKPNSMRDKQKSNKPFSSRIKLNKLFFLRDKSDTNESISFRNKNIPKQKKPLKNQNMNNSINKRITNMISRQDISNSIALKYAANLYPNLPIYYWNAIKHKLSSMFLSNDSCSAFPDLYKLRITNKYWQYVHFTKRTTVHLYSAHYDKRDISGQVVKIIAMINRTKTQFPGNRTFYCQFWFKDENEPVIVSMDTPEYIWPETWSAHSEGQFAPYIVPCPIPPSHNNKIPQVVSFVEKPCDCARNMLRVIFVQPKKRKEFAVCVKALDYLQIDISFKLVEWIEFLTLMGVDKIFFYQMEVGPRVKKVLDYYKALGKVDVRDITLSGIEPSITYLQHVYISDNVYINTLNELIQYNDCFYRNLYSYDYIGIFDVDEIIMPLKDKNWHDLLKRVTINGASNAKYNSFTAQHIYYLERMDRETPYKDFPPYMHMMQHVYRSQNFTDWYSFVKTIFNTNETFSCHNHFPIKVSNRSVKFNFDYDVARVQHYRLNCSPEVDCKEFDQNPVKDTRLWDFKDELVPRVQKVVDSIGLLDVNEDDLNLDTL